MHFLVTYPVFWLRVNCFIGVRWDVSVTDEQGNKVIYHHVVRFPEARWRLMYRLRWLGRYSKAKRLMAESKIPVPFFFNKRGE